MFPYKLADSIVLQDRLSFPVGEFISCLQAFYQNVVDKRGGYIRDFVLEDMRHVSMHDLHRVCVAHWYTGESKGSKW